MGWQYPKGGTATSPASLSRIARYTLTTDVVLTIDHTATGTGSDLYDGWSLDPINLDGDYGPPATSGTDITWDAVNKRFTFNASGVYAFQGEAIITQAALGTLGGTTDAFGFINWTLSGVGSNAPYLDNSIGYVPVKWFSNQDGAGFYYLTWYMPPLFVPSGNTLHDLSVAIQLPHGSAAPHLHYAEMVGQRVA